MAAIFQGTTIRRQNRANVVAILLAASAAFGLFLSGTRFFSDGTTAFGAFGVFAGLLTLNARRSRVGPRGVIVLLWTLLLAWVLVQAKIGGGDSISAQLNPSTQQLERAVQVISTAVWGLVLAAWPRLSPPPRLSRELKVVRTPNAGLLLVPLLVVFVGIGPGELWSRGTYFPSYSLDLGRLPVLAGILLLPSVFVLAYGATTSTRIGVRRLNWVAIAFYCMLFLGQTSRKFPVAVLAITAVRIVFGSERRRLLVAVAGVWVALAALSVSIQLRGEDRNGLKYTIPRLASETLKPSAPLDVFKSNVGFSFPLTAVVAAQRPPVAKELIDVSLNPLPSVYTTWETNSSRLRINAYTPFNGLGELAQSGLPVVLLFSFLTGVILNVAVTTIERLRRSIQGPFYLLYLGVAGNLGITMLQYNLRSSARFVYYTLLSSLILRTFQIVLSGRTFGSSTEVPGEPKRGPKNTCHTFHSI